MQWKPALSKIKHVDLHVPVSVKVLHSQTYVLHALGLDAHVNEVTY